MPLKLDLRDRKLLFELDLNSRAPFSEIAGKVALSKQVVSYRVQRLLDAGVVGKFLTILDTAKLGFTTYKILLRLQNVNKEKEIEIVDFLTGSSYVQWFASTDGNFDMAFNILAESAADLYNKLKELEARFGDFIAEINTNIMVLANFYPRNYLLGVQKREKEKQEIFGSKPEDLMLDKADRVILAALAADARAPNTMIARQAKLSPDSIRLRIRQLEKNKIIQGYSIVLDNEIMGQMHYKVLFSLRSLSPKRERAFDGFLAGNPNIYFSNKGIGHFDFEANLEVGSQAQFRRIMLEFKEKFSDIIKNYTVLQMYKVHKFNFYPISASRK